MDTEVREYSYRDAVMHWLPSVIMLPLMVWLLINRGDFTVLDTADLIIHEAGHLFFMIFGKFIYALGGTLMQIILPCIIGFYFLRSGYKTGVQTALFWLGQNLINISVYAADAGVLKLRLLGGSKVSHDWLYLLKATGLLEYYAEAGYFFVALACAVFLLALAMPLIMRFEPRFTRLT